jgi:hypothetical protein
VKPLATIVAAALLASPAAAAIHQVNLTGTLVSQLDDGSDPNLSVGSLFTLNATIDMTRAVLWGDFGFYVAAPESFTITAGGMTWIAGDDVLDGFPIYTYDSSIFLPDGTLVQEERAFGRPVIAFANGKVVGLAGDLLPAETSDRPELILGSSFSGNEFYFNEGPGEPVMGGGTFNATIESVFRVLPPMGQYGNEYETPGFTGVWNFAGSSVHAAAIPEPANWMLLILGFGAVGAALRRRHPVAA